MEFAMQTAREMYHAFRRNGARIRPRPARIADVHFSINRRERLARAISGKVEDGRVGIIRCGRDCDCSDYVHRYTVEVTSLVRFWCDEVQHDDFLDGPCASYYVPPSELQS